MNPCDRLLSYRRRRRSDLGIHMRPTSSASEAGSAGKTCRSVPSPWRALMRSYRRRISRRNVVGRLVDEQCRCEADPRRVDQIAASPPATASSLSSVTVALTASFSATLPGSRSSGSVVRNVMSGPPDAHRQLAGSRWR